jgi:DNA-binding MurR/RpiR family transcriptional regulator
MQLGSHLSNDLADIPMLNLDASAIYGTPLMQQLVKMSRSSRPALRKVCDYILRHPLSAATLTIDTMAARAESSTAAVNRLANAMGLNGYTGLHNALVSNLLDLIDPQEQVHGELRRRPQTGFCLEKQTKVAKGNLDGVSHCNDPDTLQAMVRRLLCANRIYVLGLGNSFYLAGLAAASLLPVCPNTTTVGVEGGVEMAAYRLASIGRGDVLLAISVPNYAQDTLRLANFAREHGASVLALTDSPASPLSQTADLALYASTSHPVLQNSKVALHSLIEAVVAATFQADSASVDRSLGLAARMLAYPSNGLDTEPVPQHLHAESPSFHAQPKPEH